MSSIALSSPVLLPLILTSPPAVPAARHPVEVPTTTAQPVSGWRTAALAWILPTALAWIATFGCDAWEWHVRTQDATQRYEPFSLATRGPVAPVPSGSHLALQGRFLWERMAVRRERGLPESSDVPVVDDAWREGEPVRIVAKFDSHDVPAWRASEKERRGPILARAEGGVPTAAFDVFARAGAPLAPSASLIVPVAAADGQPAQPRPAFDLENALLLSTVLTAVWTACALAIALAFVKEAWGQRRRARRAAKGVVDGPRNWVWIGRGMHCKRRR